MAWGTLPGQGGAMNVMPCLPSGPAPSLASPLPTPHHTRSSIAWQSSVDTARRSSTSYS